jgi:hypothetical protein
MKLQALMFLLSRGGGLGRTVPGLLTFLRRWWWALLLGGVLMLGLLAWLAVTLLLWAWHTLPDVLAYVVQHFAPVWQAAETQ